MGEFRWRPPQPPPSWHGVRDASQYAASCPQPPSGFAGPGPFSEGCPYLNVATPTLRHDNKRPALVFIHGGGFTQDASHNYDGSKLAASGTVVVTIDFRLGALGFLAHPALASGPAGATGNYGLMDQQVALRWVQRSIAQFGGDPHRVTIGGQSSGGVSVLAHLVSPGSRGLFQRAIVESGAFALNQQPLDIPEAAGEAFAAKAGYPDQTAACLRNLSVADLVNNFPGSAIPGVVDGKVLTEPIGAALAVGRFARVPIIDGIDHDEELIFVKALGVAVSGGTFVQVPQPVNDQTYQQVISAVLGVSSTRAAQIASEYPADDYESVDVALSTLVSDANFTCPALQVDRWTSQRVPTFAYQFNDETAPQRFDTPGDLPTIATHSSELQYLFDQPNTPVPATLNADQQALAATIRNAWAKFAVTGNASSRHVQRPAIGDSKRVLSLVSPQTIVENDFASSHHCAFWAAA